MRVYNFIFFCLYSFVPKKAMFGQRNVAAILLSIITSLVSIIFYSFALAYLFRDFQKSAYSDIGFFSIIVINFYVNWRIFSKRERMKMVLSENDPVKFYHKLIGAGMLIIVCILFVEAASYLAEYNVNHMGILKK